MRLLVCGGAGFIGSNFVRVRVRDHGDEVVVLDKLTYAGPAREPPGRRARVRPRRDRGPATRSAEAMDGVDAVVNFAAETHVDRSIAEPDAFVRTHAPGTYVLLEAARARGVRYLQVSTDEVYGSIEEGSFTEESPLAPVLALQRDEGRRRPARRQLPPHLRARDARSAAARTTTGPTSTPRSSSR